jgi:hypothetical protein
LKLLITGSREANEVLLKEAENTAISFMLFADYDDEILVGDANGVDTKVIEVCDKYNFKVTVFGGYHKVRNKTKTGTNLATGLTYPQRDALMAKLCTHCRALWNGSSSGTKLTYDFAKLYEKKVKIFTEREGWK